MTMFISIAVAMVIGVLVTRVTKSFNMPDVTAYLVAGILVGPFCLGRLGIPGLGFISYEEVDGLAMFSNLALGFIAFAIGTEFMMPKLKKIGRRAKREKRKMLGQLQEDHITGNDHHAHPEIREIHKSCAQRQKQESEQICRLRIHRDFLFYDSIHP